MRLTFFHIFIELSKRCQSAVCAHTRHVTLDGSFKDNLCSCISRIEAGTKHTQSSASGVEQQSSKIKFLIVWPKTLPAKFQQLGLVFVFLGLVFNSLCVIYETNFVKSINKIAFHITAATLEISIRDDKSAHTTRVRARKVGREFEMPTWTLKFNLFTFAFPIKND